MASLEVPAPMIIGPRLLPALRIQGVGVLYVYPVSTDEDGRIVYRTIIDDKNGQQILDESKISQPGEVDLIGAMRAFLSFLGSAAEAVAYDSYGSGRSENRDLYDEPVMRWCHRNSDELSMADLELFGDADEG